jgi:hypothetical protein
MSDDVRRRIRIPGEEIGLGSTEDERWTNMRAVSPTGRYERLVRILDESEAPHRLIDHEPKGRTAVVSPIRSTYRGNAPYSTPMYTS